MRNTIAMDVSEIGVVIPAYNAGSTLQGVIDALCGIGFSRDHIVVVDDGSCDNTAEILRSSDVQSIFHVYNKGKGAALKTGFEYMGKRSLQGVVTLDADGQHRIQDIPLLLAQKHEYDMVIGTRSDVTVMPSLRLLVNRITSLVISIMSRARIPDVQCGFRYISMPVLKCIRLRTNHYQTESELVYRAFRRRFRVGFVKVATLYDTERSYIDPMIDTLRFIVMAVRLLWH
jgi:glycosyltransferase involved in cell wall biosynthesis